VASDAPAAIDPLPDVLEPVEPELIEPVPIEPVPIVLVAVFGGVGAMLPGETPGVCVAAGAFGAPVGAGDIVELCAIAAPAVIRIAAEASKSVRICISFGEKFGW